MVVGVVALCVAASGTAIAATKLVSGDKLIAKNSLSANRLRNHTISGTQVNLSKLGTVPSATNATNATNATTATTANNANNLGGQPPSSYLTAASNRIGTNGVVKEAGAVSPGNNVTLFTVGPFTVSMNCTKSGSTTSLTINASSSEANSVLFGVLVPAANTPTDIGPDKSGTAFATNNNNAVDFEAPSGAGLEFSATDGIDSLGTDCWANWEGIR